jgi:hypothetical protein
MCTTHWSHIHKLTMYEHTRSCHGSNMCNMPAPNLHDPPAPNTCDPPTPNVCDPPTPNARDPTMPAGACVVTGPAMPMGVPVRGATKPRPRDACDNYLMSKRCVYDSLVTYNVHKLATYEHTRSRHSSNTHNLPVLNVRDPPTPNAHDPTTPAGACVATSPATPTGVPVRGATVPRPRDMCNMTVPADANVLHCTVLPSAEKSTNTRKDTKAKL